MRVVPWDDAGIKVCILPGFCKVGGEARGKDNANGNGIGRVWAIKNLPSALQIPPSGQFFIAKNRNNGAKW